MRPQIFHNRQGESFQEIPDSSLGEFFQQKHLGRGLATLDWNRDGKTDFAVTHLHAAFSLVTNHTEWTSSPLRIRLITNRNRTAVGARLRVRVRGRDFYRLAIAGDGYMATNDDDLTVAVPTNSKVEELEVAWPNGERQVWLTPEISGAAILIEGRSQIYSIVK